MPKKNPKKNPDKKKTDKKKSVRRKKVKRRKKPIRREKSTRSNVPSGSSSAQMHQAVGPQTASQSEIAPEISDDSGEFGGES
jgi:predicted DNA-binding helix-hairpin-helix protein